MLLTGGNNMTTRKTFIELPQELKECNICHWALPRSEFNKNSGTKDKLSSKCRQCAAEYRKIYYYNDQEAAISKTIEWQRKNPDRYNARNRKWCSENKDKIRATVKRFYFNHPTRRRVKTLKKYGLTIETYNQMLFEQNGKCVICGIPQEEMMRPFAVDHCHRTGKVRGLLCFCCNTMLGKVNDNVNILISAIEYLERSKEQ